MKKLMSTLTVITFLFSSIFSLKVSIAHAEESYIQVSPDSQAEESELAEAEQENTNNITSTPIPIEEDNNDTSDSESTSSTTPKSGFLNGRMYNNLIEYTVSNNGKFSIGTTGGDPNNPNDDNKRLLFGHPFGTTSFTTIKVDGTDNIFQAQKITHDESNLSTTAEQELGEINIKQVLSIVSNSTTNDADNVQIKYIITNNGATSHEIGTRIMMDTQLGGNDSAPFRVPDLGEVTTEVELAGNDVPEYWQAFDNLSNPSIISQGTLLRTDNKPDKMQFASWSAIENTTWDYTVDQSKRIGDSAVAVYWNPKELAPGETREYVTYYGLSSFIQDMRPPIGLSLSRVSNIDATDEGYYPNPISIAGYVSNTGTSNAKNIIIKIHLPEELNLEDENNEIKIDNLNIGENKEFSWKVVLPDLPYSKSFLYSVEVTADNVAPKTVSNIFSVPASKKKADLKVERVSVTQEVYYFQPIKIKWTVSNIGSLSANYSNWVDSVYISQNPEFNQAESTLIGRFNNKTYLVPGESYTNETSYTSPRGSEGDYYVHIITDSQDNIIEGNDTNNTVEGMPVTIVDKYPDLIVKNISVAQSVYAFQPLKIKWEIENTGDLDADFCSWNDTIYLSMDSEFDKNTAINLGSYTNKKQLAQGESYNNEVSCNLPRNMFGSFYIFIEADNNDDVYELDEMNNVGSANVEILDNLPDLSVESVFVPESSITGKPFNIRWEVKNTGDIDADFIRWYDGVYISQSPEFDKQSAKYIGRIENKSYISAGDSYIQDATFNMPYGLSGKNYIFVVADYNDSLYEKSESDNVSAWTEIEIIDKMPDLVVESVYAPQTAYSGKKIVIDWVVKNAGDIDTSDTSWNDYVYISPSPVFDANTATLLGQMDNKSFLADGESYRGEKEFSLPNGLSGTYYIHVITDYSNGLYERNESNNAGTSKAFNIILSPSPDLTVSSIVVPSTSFSGMVIDVRWTVENKGVGATENYWKDKIYISKDPTFDTANAKLIGSKSHNIRLAAGESYSEMMDVSVTDAVYGNHYIFVVTDAENTVYEHAAEDNNISEAGEINIMLRPSADLEVISVNTADSAVSGSSIDVTWKVENNGNGPTIERRWVDRIYLSTLPYLDDKAVAITSVYHSGDVVQGGLYTAKQNILIPQGLSGEYYILVYTDCDNQVFEFNSEDNNVGHSKIIDIKPAVIDTSNDSLEDIAVVNAEVSTTNAKSGESVNVRWEVKNVSADNMKSSYWVDGVYISKYDSLDNGEYTCLDSHVNRTPLTAGSLYTRNMNVKLPNGISGEYYIIISTDIYNSVKDVNRSNNSYCISTPINISLSPNPDLKLLSVTSDVYGISGQPIDISWEVINQGDAPANSTWYDSIYLSKDAFYDYSDRCLSSIRNKEHLDINEHYNNTATVQIPNDVSGNYCILIRTDSRDDIYEHNSEGNNVKVLDIEIKRMPPADLTVDSINVPEQAVPGDEVTINWSIANKGISNARGWMSDSIYISKDKIWDIDDVHFGDLKYYIDLVPNSKIENQLKGKMPGVTPGDFYIIVKTDILNQIYEVDDTNNAGVSVKTIKTEVESLNIGVPISFTVENGVYKYYKISAQEGKDILVKLDSESSSAANELYVACERVPDRSDFDYCFSMPNEPDQEIVIPETKEGDYYITVYCGDTQGEQMCKVETEFLEFCLMSIDTTKGGQGGKVTVRLKGAKFSPNISASLVGNEFSVNALIYWVNSSMAYATFDLTNVPIGIYSIEISQDDLQSRLDNIFTVEKKTSDLQIDLKTPSIITPWGIGVVTIDYFNAGNIDENSLIVISSENAEIWFAWANNDNASILVSPATKDVPNILEPGAHGSIQLYFKPTVGVGGQISIDLDTVMINYEEVSNNLDESDILS